MRNYGIFSDKETQAFIDRVLGTKLAARLNFNQADFGKNRIKNKDAIRFLYMRYGRIKELNDVQPSNRVDMNQLNTSIRILKRSNRFNDIYDANIKGVGPGEVLLYLLLNNSYLGGGKSAGADIFVDNIGYEIKAVKISAETNIASDFRFGGTIDAGIQRKIISSLEDLVKQYNNKTNKTLKATSEAINKLVIDEIKRSEFKNAFEKIEEQQFREFASSYFKKPVIFIDNRNNSTKGIILYSGEVLKDNIFIHRVTQGTVRPAIKFANESAPVPI